MSLSLDDVLHADRHAAESALRAVGGVVLPELALEVDVPGVGTLERHFAYLGNTIGQAGLSNRRLHDRMAALLESPDNERVLRKLQAGRLGYMPANKRAARKLVPDLHALHLHLPWAFRPMNFDFGARLEELSERRPVAFTVFYIQGIDISADGTVEVKRVFSLPVQGSAHGTFQEPIFDEMLDEDVGLFIEANVRKP
jgi:hypothetical protein